MKITDTYLQLMLEKYRNKGIIIDANVLLPFISGSVGSLQILRHDKTGRYSQSDLDKIVRFIDLFENKITTPHILAEVSNLIDKDRILQSALWTFIKISNEQITESAKLCEEIGFLELGLTDAGIIYHCRDSFLVVTMDGPLYNFLQTIGIDVVTFDQISKISGI
jgi:hypothetical protein